ncbi:hypothetical protein HRbin22_01940 [Candidatus Thermoflexus japonica]|uniref:Uncharacterized protein n=1 Tax=Candidatus Thermoflexus japonica TaxID=2035417 RepID=A0A2H5Y8B9_9CHLR|nr:hypothetical protein HRbin22_01940 [Candidatus Thermoflexus japonica]
MVCEGARSRSGAGVDRAAASGAAGPGAPGRSGPGSSAARGGMACGRSRPGPGSASGAGPGDRLAGPGLFPCGASDPLGADVHYGDHGSAGGDPGDGSNEPAGAPPGPAHGTAEPGDGAAGQRDGSGDRPGSNGQGGLRTFRCSERSDLAVGCLRGGSGSARNDGSGSMPSRATPVSWEMGCSFRRATGWAAFAFEGWRWGMARRGPGGSGVDGTAVAWGADSGLSRAPDRGHARSSGGRSGSPATSGLSRGHRLPERRPVSGDPAADPGSGRAGGGGRPGRFHPQHGGGSLAGIPSSGRGAPGHQLHHLAPEPLRRCARGLRGLHAPGATGGRPLSSGDWPSLSSGGVSGDGPPVAGRGLPGHPDGRSGSRSP